MTVRDDAPYGYDELRDWVMNHPIDAAMLIEQYRTAQEANDERDRLDVMFGDNS